VTDDARQNEPKLECAGCGRRIDYCACCEDEACEKCICHRCLMFELGQARPSLHTHGG
jgi:hypothetical protein